ncbi:hypothetical protein PIB30_058509 [Stylosanthes scabra]|uniref:Uncharacterized protein n=1 Tax=Stylosanthes scabra TaxID=79078 RepID=A0ABU6VL08_9FABA|nr:hypothetical protein [Stylosanthes scabra]
MLVAQKKDPDSITPEIELLAGGPNDVIKKFEEYNIHGFKFCTMKKDEELKTKNSGVIMNAITNSVSSGKNYVVVSSDSTYYGELEADEPFILATDVRMVYYVDHPSDVGWCFVCHMKPIDLYDMGDLNEEDLDESLVEDVPFCEQQIENLEEFHLFGVMIMSSRLMK